MTSDEQNEQVYQDRLLAGMMRRLIAGGYIDGRKNKLLNLHGRIPISDEEQAVIVTIIEGQKAYDERLAELRAQGGPSYTSDDLRRMAAERRAIIEESR